MIPAPIGDDDEQRLQALALYEILDTLPERVYDDIAKLAAYICDTPLALVSLVDRDRQWFKAKTGIDAEETPRDVSFCGHAIVGQDPIMEVSNALEDKRFHDNPFVTGDLSLRFYAGAVLRVENGHNIGTLCVIASEPRQLTANQRDALMVLARQVTDQLELRLARRRAEQAVERRGQFIARVSHEIRTPLTGIIGMAELALDPGSGLEAIRNHVGTIKSCGQNLLPIINDILDFTKVDSGHLKLNQESFSLKRLISDIDSLVRQLAENKGLEFINSSDSSFPDFVVGDPLRLRQVLLNLLTNSVKFTNQGKVELRSSGLSDTGDDSVLLRLEVIDTGIGIDSQALEHIFDAYEQAHSRIAQDFGGTGLGLAISKGFVDLMGGSIKVESSPGSGSHFSIEIPLKRGEAPVESPKEQIAEGAVDVLVVEDNQINQKLARSFLEKLGCKVVVVNNGQEAVDILKKRSFPLCFMDCQMPVMDGFTATRTIIEEFGVHDRPYIVAMTANALDTEEQKCYDAGMQGYVTKPFNKVSLAAAISEFRKQQS